MKGTAILYQHEEGVIFLEDIDKKLYEEIKIQCGCEHCNCSLGQKHVDFGNVSPVFWLDEDIDWEYGY